MKNSLKKITLGIKNKLVDLYKLCKKNYTASLVIISIILIVIGSLVIIKMIDVRKNKIVLKENKIKIYYHFQNQKIEKKANIKYENNHIVSIDVDKKKVDADIIYIDSQKHIILPKKSAIVLLDTNNNYYGLNLYTEVENDNGTNIVINNGNKIASYNFLIYDGFETYLFISEAAVKINDIEYSLTPYSYITIDHGFAKIYDYESDTITYLESPINKASASYQDVKIDLLNKLLIKNDERIILDLNLDNVPNYEEVS